VRNRQKKKEKQNIFLFLFFSPSRPTTKRSVFKQGRAKDDRISNIERRHHVTSRHDNVYYGNDVPDDIKVDNVLSQESPQPDTGPGGSNSKSKSQKQDQIIIKRQTEITKNNKVHLK